MWALYSRLHPSLSILYSLLASYRECHRCTWRIVRGVGSRDSLSRTTRLARNLYSSYWGIPFRLYNGALVRRPPRLGLWLQFHEQHHVRHPVRDLAGAVPNKGSWDRKCTRRSRESCVWDHGADYRSLRKPKDICADLCFSFFVYYVGFHSTIVTV